MDIDISQLDFDCVDIFVMDNVNAVVMTENIDFMTSLRNHFTDKVKNFQFMPAFRAGTWDGRIRHIKNDGLFAVGLIPEMTKKMDEWDIPFRIHQDDEAKVDISNFDAVIQDELIDKQDTPMQPWEHQTRIAKTLLEHKRGIARSATSSGKTYTMAMICKYLLYTKLVKNILIIVPKIDLVVQGQRDFMEFGYTQDEVGMYFGEVKDTSTPIIISTWQSLMNIKDKEFFENFECVIGDEVHLAGEGSTKSKTKSQSGGTIFKRCIDSCKNATYRFGLTGTMPSDRLNQRSIRGCLGDVLVEVTANELMKKKHVADLKIVLTLINYEDMKSVKKEIKEFKKEYDEDASTSAYNAERDFIQSYVPRYRLVTKIVNKCLKSKENVLVLASTIEFGKKLKSAIEHKCKDLTFVEHIYGEMPVKERQAIIKKVEENTNCVMVATTSLFSTGISVKNLHTAILANFGKSKITNLQAVGRILRLHDSKDSAKVFDLIDNGLKYSEQHGALRVEYYDSEQFDTIIYETEI